MRVYRCEWSGIGAGWLDEVGMLRASEQAGCADGERVVCADRERERGVSG